MGASGWDGEGRRAADPSLSPYKTPAKFENGILRADRQSALTVSGSEPNFSNEPHEGPSPNGARANHARVRFPQPGKPRTATPGGQPEATAPRGLVRTGFVDFTALPGRQALTLARPWLHAARRAALFPGADMATALAIPQTGLYRHAQQPTAPVAPGEPTTARWRLQWAQRRHRVERACRAVSRRVLRDIMWSNLGPGERR